MIRRDIEDIIPDLLKGFPIVTITGPRQSGKTTLARRVFAHKPYLSLEEPDIRQMAIDDPRAFLGRLPEGAVLDEVQRAPEILSYLQARVDALSPSLIYGGNETLVHKGIRVFGWKDLEKVIA